MFKKLLGLSLVFTLVVLVMTGCGKEQVEEPADNSQTDLSDALTYAVNVEQTTIGWEGEMILIGKAHHGLVSAKSGNLMVKEGQIVGGEVIMDMTTIIDQDLEGDSKTELEDHLKGNDFFAVENYPEAKFVITNVEPVMDGEVNQYDVTADLTIKDKTNSISFPAMIEVSETVLTAQGELIIDRTLWDVRWGSDKFFDDLGDEVLADNIKFTIDLQADFIEDVVLDVVEEEAVTDNSTEMNTEDEAEEEETETVIE